MTGIKGTRDRGFMKLDENKMECPVCGTYMVKCGQCKYIHFRCPNHEVSCMVPMKMFKSKFTKGGT